MQTYGSDEEYRAWVLRYDTLDDAARDLIRQGTARLMQFPLFSLVPLPGTPLAAYRDSSFLQALRRQLYPHWEFVIPTDVGSAVPDQDARVRKVGGRGAGDDVAGTFGVALEAARGDYVVPLPADARLAEHALYELAVAIARDPEADLVYGDEDHINLGGERCNPWFKTGWDPDLALERDAIGVPAAHRTSLLRAVHNRRPPTRAQVAALYALSLWTAFAASPGRIHHIPAILCHRTVDAEPRSDRDAEEMRAVVRARLAEDGIVGTVEAAPATSRWSWIERALPEPAPVVSIIVPTRDRADLLERCVTSLLSKTDYAALEVLVVDNDSRDPVTIALLHRLAAHPLVRVLPYPGAFNYAAMNNFAAREARGEILVLLNNDTEVSRPGWLRAMVAHAVRPDVGAVGARLLYPDGRVQHAGMVFQPGVGPVHQYRFSSRDDPGPAGALCLTRSVTMVTGACLALRRALYFEAGGLDEGLRVAFNDVDLCMRLGDYGYRIVCSPASELFHYESASRGYDVTPEKQALSAREFDRFRRRWGSLLDVDPFRNPNVNYGWDSVVLAAPPQRPRPWMVPGAEQRMVR